MANSFNSATMNYTINDFTNTDLLPIVAAKNVKPAQKIRMMHVYRSHSEAHLCSFCQCFKILCSLWDSFGKKANHNSPGFLSSNLDIEKHLKENIFT